MQVVPSVVGRKGVSFYRFRNRVMAGEYTGFTDQPTYAHAKEIAAALGLSVHTVERHLTNLYPKIGCRSRTEAAAFALTHGYA